MLNRFFKLDEKGTNVKREIIAGITTFLAMAYILGVNPTILSAVGMPVNAVFFATALSSGIACIVMGLVSNYPIGLSAGMGLNALFTYTVVMEIGLSWQAALVAVFLSSVIFLIITIAGFREVILNAINEDLKQAIGCGIGFFLAFLGLANAGIVVSNPLTIVSLGNLTSPHVVLAIFGIVFTLVLYLQRIPAAVFFGLVSTAILGVIFTSMGFY